jgi:small subunit ribosomal protein S6
MPKPAAYDLFVLLDLESPDERRAGVIDQVRRQIQERGALKGDVDWGSRKLAYEIDHRGEAQYHLFQFEATPDLLSELDRSLSIDDAVIRHRIIRLPGAAPDTPPKPPAEEPRRTEERGDRGDRGDRGRGRGPRPDSAEEPVAAEEPAGDSENAPAAPAEEAAPAASPAEAESPAEAPPAEEPVAAEQPAGDSSEQS